MEQAPLKAASQAKQLGLIKTQPEPKGRQTDCGNALPNSLHSSLAASRDHNEAQTWPGRWPTMGEQNRLA